MILTFDSELLYTESSNCARLCLSLIRTSGRLFFIPLSKVSLQEKLKKNISLFHSYQAIFLSLQDRVA